MKLLLPMPFNICSFSITFRRRHRYKVGPDTFVPESEPSEYMRGHVLCMGRARSNGCVFSSGRQSDLGETRIIAVVNNVMRDPRMQGLFFKNWIQQRKCLSLVRVSFICRISSCVQCE